MKIGIAILAGGKNSRFGGVDKAFVLLNKKPIIDYILEKANVLFDEVIVVTNNSSKYFSYPNLIFAADSYSEIGPLAGIHAAVSISKSDAVFVVSCDMPLLDLNLMTELLEFYNNSDSDILVPKTLDYIQPLHAIYSVKIKEKLAAFIENSDNYSIRNFYKLVNIDYYQIDENSSYQKSFTNINNQNDLIEVSLKIDFKK